MPRSNRTIDDYQPMNDQYSTDKFLENLSSHNTNGGGDTTTIYEKNIFDSSFPLPDSKHILLPTLQSNNEDSYGKRAFSYPTIPSNYRRGVEPGGGGGGFKSKYHGVHRTSSGLTFRSADSTQRALHELAQQKYEAMEKRRAGLLLICLVMIAWSVHYITSTGLLRGQDPLALTNDGNNEPMNNVLSTESDNYNNNGGLSENVFQGKMDTMINNNGGGGGDAANTGIDQQGMEPEEVPPEEEIIEPGKEFLQPLRYFADTTTSQRKSDVNFFFHIPRYVLKSYWSNYL